MDTVLRGTVLDWSPQKVTQMFHARFQDVKRNDIHRLVVSEMGHVAEEAAFQSYEENEIEQYEYMATLESHTCDTCGRLDGQMFRTDKRIVGINYPLIHARCRCTTVPYIEGIPGTFEQWMRDPETGKGKMIKNVKFSEWKRQYVDLPLHERKYAETYELLGKNAPTRLEYDAIRSGSVAEQKLTHDIKTVKYIRNSTSETESFNRREIAEKAYFSFKRDEINISGHAALQYAVRMQRKKTGRILFNFNTVKTNSLKPANYIDTRNSRMVHYYGKLAVIKEPDTGEVVTIIRQRKVGKRWKQIEKE
ncbi:minor capsid protein [Levilactobacillus yiduensis]|uniref:minor capsid protein n=1 Tax=Levilactobacillus yiduensis TaxID=2953880 RepID=UPI000EF2C629|nr:minor capsid protein [Levilactobacillus yiduensis]AYM03958.1 hypothetical protein D8911_13595 [Levilactobacillus brevis]